MPFEEILLWVLPILLLFGLPVYTRSRAKMKETSKDDYSQKRVIKLTLFNLGLNTGALTFFFLLFVNILVRISVLDLSDMLAMTFFILGICLTFYGNGIYLTSIVLESYTLPQIRLLDQFKTQFIVTHLFHGPLSHILIYSCWLLAFLGLTMLDLLHLPMTVNTPAPILFILGGLVGGLYAIAQIYNGSAPYQLIAGLGITGIMMAILLLSPNTAVSSPLAMYFLGVNLIFNIVLLIYVFKDKKDDGCINWDRSGY